MTSIAEEYRIGRPTVHDIFKSEDKLRCFQSELHDNNCTKKQRAIRMSDHQLSCFMFDEVPRGGCMGRLCKKSSKRNLDLVICFVK